MSRSAPASTIGWVPARAMAMGLAARAMGVMRSLKSIRKVVFAPFRAGSIAKNERNETLRPRRKSADATAKLLARNSTKARPVVRFQHSRPIAAGTFANVGIKGPLAKY